MTRETSPLAYQPALDGVRAVAVVMVVCFHAGFGWMAGGYLGVSIFFTLSGFLITRLLLTEFDDSGRVDLGRFFARRLRRLLPAALVCLALIAVVRSAGGFGAVPGLRRDLIGAATNAFNWVRIAGDSSYVDIFADRAQLVSPVEHYWSLAIEEQFYLVWPIVVVLIGARSRTRRIVGAFVASAVAALLVAQAFGPDVAYWSTVTRLPELLAGAALAAVVSVRRVPPWAGRVAAPAGAALLALAALLPSGSGPAHTGSMAPIALVSAALLWALQSPSIVRRALCARPLVALGTVSYGVYLFHWPVFVLLRARGWQLASPSGFVVAAAVTLALAVVSYHVVERPIRELTWAARATMPAAVTALAAAIVAFAVLPMPRGFLEADDAAFAAAAAPPVESLTPLVPAPSVPRPATSTSDPPSTSPVTSLFTSPVTVPVTSPVGPTSAPPASAPSPPTVPASDTIRTTDNVAETDIELPEPPSRPVRILTVGDSTAFYVGQALAQWAVAHPAHATSNLLWCQGCGFIVDGTITSFDAERFVERSRKILGTDLPAAIERVRPDVVVLMTTINDVTTRQWIEAEGPLTPSDPVFVERIEQRYGEVSDALLAAGVRRVIWIAPATPDGYMGGDELFGGERWSAMRAAIHDIAEERAAVSVADLQAWATTTGSIGEPTWRPDGTHLTETSAREVVDRWLAPLIIRVALAEDTS